MKIRFRQTWTAINEPGRTVRGHAHEEFWELILLVSGRLEARDAAGTYDLKPGDMMLNECGAYHGWQVSGSRSAHVLYLTWETQRTAHPQVFIRHDRRGRIRQQLEWLQEIRWGSSNEPDQDVLHAMMLTVLHELNTLAVDNDSLSARCAAWIATHLEQPISVEDLAGICGLSTSHFARRFRGECEETPMAMVQRLRLERARQMIQGSNLKLEQIAMSCGFADGAHLAHACQRFYGHSPSDWR